MKKLFEVCICCLLFIMAGCINKRNDIARLWFYTHADQSVSSGLTPVSFLDLQDDGTYTIDFGEFKYGKWTFKNDKLILLDDKSGETIFVVNKVRDKELSLVNEKGNGLLHFEGFDNRFEDKRNNPFSVQNNKWRIRAVSKETETVVRERLINHFRFFETYFSWAHSSNFTSVDARSTPSLLKIYGNGFSLKPYEELPVVWRSYFFDSTDCKMANNIVEDVFRKNDLAWARTESKFKMFISAFQQLQSLVKK